MFEDVPRRRLRIIVEHAPGLWRYIAKIHPYSDGGFAFIPAYKGFDGHIMKVKADDTFSHLIRPSRPVALGGRSVSHRVKASFHHDGFTQISAADLSTSVTSGRDPDGTFKGMGVAGRPFTNPVFTGGVVSMTAWGLPFYQRTTATRDVIRFSRAELGRKALLRDAAILIMGFLIRRSEEVKTTSDYPDARIRSIRWNSLMGRREDMELRVCNLHSSECYLGIAAIRIPHPNVSGNPSGYMMSTQRDRKENVGLHVFFPAPRGAKTYGTLNRGIDPKRLILPFDC